MNDFSPSDLKTILHYKRANLYYLEHCRVLFMQLRSTSTGQSLMVVIEILKIKDLRATQFLGSARLFVGKTIS